MAVTPIEIFTPNNGILSLLGDASNKLAQGLNNAVQVGRDLANNQQQDQRDILGEQRAGINLAQRRGELVQQQANADRTFEEGVRREDRTYDRRVFEDERDYEMDVAKTNRTAAFDALRIDHDQTLEKQADKRLDFEERRINSAIRSEERDRQFNRDLLQPEATLPFTGPPAPGDPLPDSPGSRSAKAGARAEAAQKLGNAAAYEKALEDKAIADEEIRAERKPAESLSRERLDFSKGQAAKAEEQKRATTDFQRAEKEAKLLVKGPGFKTQTSSLELDKDGKNFKDPKAALAAEAWDKNQFESEAALAQTVSEEEFIERGKSWDANKKAQTISKDEEANRRKFYKLARKLGSTDTPVAEPTVPVDDEEDLYDAILNPK